MQNETHDITIEALKGSPAVAGAIASAMTLNQWVMVGTVVYILIQAMYLIRKWWREEVDRDYEKARQRLQDAREDDDWSQRHKPRDCPP